MPTYEYACASCGEHVEVVQSFSDEPLTTCPNCGGGLRKVFGAVGIVLKGSGFYRNDSRSNGSRSTGRSDKADHSGNATTSATSSGSDAGGSTESSSGSTESSSGSTEAATTPSKSAAAG